MSAYIGSDGSVTGSIHWDDLRDAAKRRDQEGVTKEGWSRVDELIRAHDEVLNGAESEAKERAKAAADANVEAGAVAPDVVAASSDEDAEGDTGPTKAELQDLLREKGLPTSGNKAELQQRLDESEGGV